MTGNRLGGRRKWCLYQKWVERALERDTDTITVSSPNRGEMGWWRRGESGPQGLPLHPPGSYEVAFPYAAEKMREAIAQLKEGKMDSNFFPQVDTPFFFKKNPALKRPFA